MGSFCAGGRLCCGATGRRFTTEDTEDTEGEKGCRGGRKSGALWGILGHSGCFGLGGVAVGRGGEVVTKRYFL